MSKFAMAGPANSRWEDRLYGAAHNGRDNEPPDYCSQAGALALKEKIEAYWRERGQNVMLSLHNVGFHPAIRAARFDVRSDMVNGMPRNYAPSPAKVAPQGPRLVDDDYADDADDLDDRCDGDLIN
jgi:hypothetical protein